jgi:hypothetical protein
MYLAMSSAVAGASESDDVSPSERAAALPSECDAERGCRDPTSKFGEPLRFMARDLRLKFRLLQTTIPPSVS